MKSLLSCGTSYVYFIGGDLVYAKLYEDFKKNAYAVQKLTKEKITTSDVKF